MTWNSVQKVLRRAYFQYYIQKWSNFCSKIVWCVCTCHPVPIKNDSVPNCFKNMIISWMQIIINNNDNNMNLFFVHNFINIIIFVWAKWSIKKKLNAIWLKYLAGYSRFSWSLCRQSGTTKSNLACEQILNLCMYYSEIQECMATFFYYQFWRWTGKMPSAAKFETFEVQWQYW